MKFLKLPKFKTPKWLSNLNPIRLFQRSESQKSFYYIWKKFLGQIPRESRPTINSYQHFIVLGCVKSGKTELIRGLIEQSQDLYPFDTSYTSDPDIQFYIGPNQVIQEISFGALEDKSIRGRRKTIKLWKKLYVRRDPIIIVAYDCLTTKNENLRELNKLAQLIAGKVSLLSEIIKKPVKVRIALTHLDQVPGYLEFARFLKQENLTFEINLSSDFESNTLEANLKKFFEEHTNLMLTSSSNRDFLKMLSFPKEMLVHFASIEEFLRVLVSRVSFANSIELDTLSLTSNQESSTSFIPFLWTRLPSMELFFRYPLLKHQLASALLFLVLITPLFYFFYKEKKELNLVQKGVEQLNLLQYKNFEKELIPSYLKTFDDRHNELIAFIRPDFFGETLNTASNRLADRMRKHYIEKEYRKAVLDNSGELKCLYFNALLNANSNNNLGKFILADSSEVADALNLDEDILKAYIHACHTINESDNATFDFVKVNPFVPFTSFTPWLNFFNKIQELSDQQIYGEQNFEDIIAESQKLKIAVDRILNDPLTHSIAAMLEEENGAENVNENIRVIRWIGENSQSLLNFLQFIEESATLPVEIEDMNIAQFFTKIKQMSGIKDRENQTYNFTVDNRLFTFHTKQWVDLVIAHNVERAIQKYIVLNNNSGGTIFFKNTNEAQNLVQPIYHGPFPYFFTQVSIPGRYTRLEYENKVRSAAEKLAHWVDTLAVNPEDKKRFTTFLVHEVIGYVQNYGSHYDQYFEKCDIQNVSLQNLKAVLRDIAQDTSSFHDFLKFMNYQTSAFSEPVITLKNMKELNQFDFLNTMLTVDKDQAPYARYQTIMAELAQDLDKEPSAGDTQFEDYIQPYLTSTAKLSSDILQNNPQSYEKRVKDTLAELAVPEKYQPVFLKPIKQLYKLGVPDLKRCIEHVWSANFEIKIDKLLAKFPFNPHGEEILSIEELESTLNPNSTFYKMLKEVMGTCSKNNQGAWIPLDSQELQLDETIFVKLNQIQRISDLLWDKTGNPQPLQINLQPIPFTNDDNANPVIVLSYFVLGDQSVRNLNQTPSWTPLKIEWWKKDNCSIGVELMSKYTNSRSYKCIQKLDSLWSFFELMKEAVRQDGNVFNWNILGDESSENYSVSFSFDKDPFNLLMRDNN